MAAAARTNGTAKVTATTAPHLLRQRLLRDVAELCSPPHYPNIRLHPLDGGGDIRQACLVLTTEAYAPRPLHLTMQLPHDYPLHPPAAKMDTPGVEHPNVFGSYICATILNDREAYTPAYTLKAVAIQLLSFFASDAVEQVEGGVVQLGDHQRMVSKWGGGWSRGDFCCAHCGYDTRDPSAMAKAAGQEEHTTAASTGDGNGDVDKGEVSEGNSVSDPYRDLPPAAVKAARSLDILSDDVVLLVLDELDFAGLTAFAAASPRVAALVAQHDLLQQRDLQCFALKTSYRDCDLGVGVYTKGGGRSRGRRDNLGSEFELLSREAFATLGVRRSVQGLWFDRWLPLPLSRRHWLRVRDDVAEALQAIGDDADLFRRPGEGRGGGRAPARRAVVRRSTPVDMSQVTEVLYALMVQIVVRLNESVDQLGHRDGDGSKSTLRHASEKAIEAYFHLFHLLVCLAADHPQVAADANRRLHAFYVQNRRSKADCHNLGVLLVALLLAGDEALEGTGGGVQTNASRNPREGLLKAIITEAITRNVVWLLDGRGAGCAELSFLEADDTVSEYRLHHTFVGSLTSYRLLMFMELFRRTARGTGKEGDAPVQQQQLSLEDVRDGLDHRHGAPPPGTAARLAAEVRRLQAVRRWPDFLQAMGVTVPTKAAFCNVLRKAVRDSMRRGYSQWALREDYARVLREYREGMFLAGMRRAATAAGHVRKRSRGGDGRNTQRSPTGTGPWRATTPPYKSYNVTHVEWLLREGGVSFFPRRGQ